MGVAEVGAPSLAAQLKAKPLAKPTNGFALSLVPFSRTAIIGLSNRRWSMSLFHRCPVRPEKHMPPLVALKRPFCRKWNEVLKLLGSTTSSILVEVCDGTEWEQI
jgi:hypothetical protein